MAGDPTYDFFLAQTVGITKLVTQNCFLNAYDLEYLDFTQPWWNNLFMEEIAVGDKYRYLLVSDYTFDTLRYTRSIFFNKVLYACYFDDADLLYQEVLDGKWTLDRMSELISSVFIDINNNGQTDLEDQIGFITFQPYGSVDPFVYATDIPFTERGADDSIRLTMMSEDAVTLAEKLPALFRQEGSFFQCENDDDLRTFMGGKALFIGCCSLKESETMRDMKEDFGFLPYPKFDEQQKEYHSLVHDTALLGAVSSASRNADIAGAVLEALSAETYRSFTPVWYETALKIKYSRDNLSSRMIDLIRDSSTTNFIYAYSSTLGDIGMIYRFLVEQNSTDYASMLKSKEKAAQKKLDSLIESFINPAG